MLKRCQLSWNARQGFHVDLPQYAMVPGTHAPVTPDLISADGVQAAPEGVGLQDWADKVLALSPSVLCEIDDRYGNEALTDIDIDRLRELHDGHPKWGDDDYSPKV